MIQCGMLLKERLNQILILLFIFLLPTQLGKYFFFDFSFISGVRIDYLAPALFLSDIVAFGIIALNASHILQFFKTYYKEVIITTILIAINIAFAYNPQVALYKWIKIAELVCIYVSLKHTHIKPIQVLYTLLLSSVLQLGLVITQQATGHAIQGIFYFLGERAFNLSTPGISKVSLQGVEVLRAYGTFSHPNSLAGFYVVIYFFTLLFHPFKKLIIPKSVVMLNATFLVFLSFSKITIVTFFIGNIIYLIWKRRTINCLMCFVGRILILTVLAAIFFSAQGDPLSSQKRIELNTNALTILSQNPLFGIGAGSYLYAQAQFPIRYAYHFLQPVHNIFLLFLTEMGIIIAVWTAWLIAKKRLWQVKNCAKLYILGVVIFTGLFDHYWFTLQQNMLLLPAIFALLNEAKDKIIVVK